MQFDNLFIAGCGTWLPEPMTVQAAEEAGLCERRFIWRTEIVSVCVAASESAPEMAAMAARPALRQAGCAPADIDLVLHAGAYYQGQDLWPAASYVQRTVLGNRCPAMEVRQMSNGGMAAMELAASYLVAGPSRRAALVTTGDRFCLPGFDRWRSDPGTICGDGGTAAVLSKDHGLARVCSLVTVSDADLEQMSRGHDRFGVAPFSVRMPVDLDAHRSDFMADVGLDFVMERIDAGQREAVDRALQDSDMKLSDIDWFVLPSLGRSRIKAHFLDLLDIKPEQTTWPWGRHVGHLGAGDQFAGLSYLGSTGRLTAGQRCLMLGVGAGFSWSAAVLEFIGWPGRGGLSSR
jgi:3-oxoacyl-[acyl-carrier-protein] synthase-3